MAIDPAIENVELDLICADLRDVLRVLWASDDGEAGVLSMLTFPAAGLVAEESYAYFRGARRAERLGSLDGPLFATYGQSLTKVRARLKLFDDTDAGPLNLVSFMSLARQQSRVLFSHPSSRVLQWLSGPFRPDLGAFFVEDRLVATTHALLPSMGVTLETLRKARPGQFNALGKYAFNFARAMGFHLAKLAAILGNRGRPVDLAPRKIQLVSSVTFNDFVAQRFYRHAEAALPTVERERVPALTLCLAQSNVATHVLPQLLGSESVLLARMQYLTAYHGSSALRSSASTLPRWLDVASGDVLASRPLRNLFAHYELRASASAAIVAQRPFEAAVESIAGKPLSSVMQDARRRLLDISEFLGERLTKPRLRSVRALLGDHS